MQRMIDVDGPQSRGKAARLCQLRQRDEQDRGVESAAQRDTEPRRFSAARRGDRGKHEIEACRQSVEGEHVLRPGWARRPSVGRAINALAPQALVTLLEQRVLRLLRHLVKVTHQRSLE